MSASLSFPRRNLQRVILLGALEIAASLGIWASPIVAAAPVIKPAILASYAHGREAFTEGLVWNQDLLYESTGGLGRSYVAIRELRNGKTLRRHDASAEIFGEGIAVVGNEIIQLTWKNHLALVYDKATLRIKRRLPYPREGWGLSYDGQHLIASDGTATLRFLDPRTLREIKQLEVRDGGQAVTNLNELEYIRGEIFANVFETDRIARISATTGQVLAWLDFSTLFPASARSDEDVLNGIAYDAKRKRMLFTGKHWPRLYEIAWP